MSPWTDYDPGQSAADAYHSARGLGTAIVLAGVIYVPIILGAIIGYGLHRGWW